MAHGGYARRRVEERRPLSRRSKGIGFDKKRKKHKSVSLKNQIRSAERLLRKDLPAEIRQAQEKKLEELKKHQEIQSRLSIERKIQLRDRKIKFFERRKIERMIRRLEKQQRTSSDHTSEGKISDQLSKLREDLEYVRFFPKTEKYVSLFVGGDNPDIVDKRNRLRKQIKANLMAAAASGKELEETASDDDALDVSEDDFFLSGSSSDEAEADDEWTDKSTREPASSASGKAASGMSSDEKNQRQISARVLMPPPRFLPPSRSHSVEKVDLSTSSNTSNSSRGPSSKNWRPVNAHGDPNSNLSSNSDARKPRRKRRPKKKKQA
ncbi:rRNA-processing protein EFG1 isoform X2 [Elaeis guineensis]|uniref:rRNA-processing protein EFG1 n=1 Tax=Elaeis guineensis var. tenera TaxID=51953 RepID=A0A6I9S182_ELAGV|nr:rRNA-processing protein efg1 isoform X2 [Elaeis guineensis]